MIRASRAGRPARSIRCMPPSTMRSQRSSRSGAHRRVPSSCREIRMTTDDVVGFVIDGDELVGQGGFLAIRRLRMRNRRADGSLSPPYVCDAIARPYGQDAGGAAARGVEVLGRAGLRPALPAGRDPARAPLPEPPPQMFLTELVAGILETGDVGEAGLRQRAAHEVEEEAGFVVEP